MKRLFAGISAIATVWGGAAMAQAVPGGLSLQPPASALAEEVHFFHDGILLPIITIICLVVLALLIWVAVRYNAKANPQPRKFSHNTLVEVIWTGIPILILLVIALPSFELLFKEDVIPDGKQVVAAGDGQTVDFVFANDFPESRMVERASHLQVMIEGGAGRRGLAHKKDFTVSGFGEPEVVVSLNQPAARGERVIIRGGRSTENRAGCPTSKRYLDQCPKDVVLAPTVTVKATGRQWGWNYSYPDFGDFEFLSDMVPADQTTPDLYRFEVNNRVVVPVGETIRVITTASDVIHSWAMPAFAIKIDAVPGRLNETWFKADREGVFYGQCSEICGVQHAFMPIAVEVVSRAQFETWIDGQRELAGLAPMFDEENVKLAQADAAPVAE